MALIAPSPHRVVLSIALAAVLLGGCYSPRWSTRFHPMSARFAARSQQAQVTRLTTEQLSARDYQQIGTIWAQQELEGGDPQAATPLALKVATEHGGDLVQLDRDNVLTTAVLTRKGRPIRWKRKKFTSWRILPAKQLGNGFYRKTSRVAETRLVKVPVAWSKVSEQVPVVVSSGVIWRHQPGERWFQLGRRLQERGDHRGAIAAYSKAYDAAPRKMAGALINRSLARRDLGDLDGAMADSNRAIEAKPRLALVWGNRAQLWIKRSQLHRALADLNRAVQLAPRSAAVRYDRGLLQERRGDRRGALADYNAALRLARRDWPKRGEVALAIRRVQGGPRGR